MKHESLTRILALDLHPRSLGYVMIESPTKLLDWGVCRSYRKQKPPGGAGWGKITSAP